MALIYSDRYVHCDPKGIRIKKYYFPLFRSRTIHWNEVKQVQKRKLTLTGGKLRIWGMDFAPIWFHWDLGRPSKGFCAVIDTGTSIKAGVTPDDVDGFIESARYYLSRTSGRDPVQ